jgi:hypothetical protein
VETVQLIRDIAIIVFVAMAFVVMAIVGVVTLKLYGKVSPILEDAGTTARNAAKISSTIASTATKPALAVMGAIGAAAGAAFAAFKRKQKKQAETG